MVKESLFNSIRLIQLFSADATNEATHGLVFYLGIHFFPESTEGINDDTCEQSQ
jgi:hypothetical protein